MFSNLQANVEDVLSSVSQNKDKDRAPISMMLYGNGDGGGGPTLGRKLFHEYVKSQSTITSITVCYTQKC